MEIPAEPADLNARWLTEALRRGGAIRDAAVVAVEVSALVEGEGAFGRLSRVRLAYDAEEPGAPTTLVVKLSSASPEMRARPATRIAYRREVRFYQRLAEGAPLATPVCHFADVDEASGRHVLVLEDLAPARSGSTVAGCGAAQAELAVTGIARLHSAWWESPELARLDWLLDVDPDPAALREAHDRWWPAFLEQAGHRLCEETREIGKGFRERLAPVLRHLTRVPPRTLVHSDYKLDNLVFDARGGSVPLLVLDWQLLGRGRGVFDVAFLLSQSLAPDDRRALEMDLLAAYHGGLIEGGVRDYPFDQCLHDYRLSLLRRFGSLISTIAAMPFTREQIEMHVDVLLPRCCAALVDHRVVDLGA